MPTWLPEPGRRYRIEKKPVDLAAVFKLLADPGRLKILLSLNACELWVCDLAALLESTPSVISHQLCLLRTAGLVQARKEGKIVYYKIEDPSVYKLLATDPRNLEKGTSC